LEPLSLEVGDLVVYAAHGVGRIESTQPAEGALAARITLAFESGLKVTLPLARARDALRSLSGDAELEDVRLTLRADVQPAGEPWLRRQRATREKVAAGGVCGLAEVVRDGLQRERRVASWTSARSAAPSERDLYRQARKLLSTEIALCRGIEADAADAWIVEQVTGAHS